MPRHPERSPFVSAIKGSVYSGLLHRMSGLTKVFPLHVGDTWMEPAEGCRMEDLTVADHPGMHRYTPPQGLPGLIDGVVERFTARTGIRTKRSEVVIVGGATAGLAAVCGAVVAAGDEVLLLAPHWPLIDGIVRMFGGTPVDVPFFDVASSAEEAVETVEPFLTEQTVALYVNSPNNPTGRMIPPAWLEALVAWARKRDLWLFCDEVYEDTVFDGEHIYGRPLAPERTFSIHSFSKAYGMAGNRCGYVVGPREAMVEVLKVATHTTYNAPTAAQLAACRVLGPVGDAWVANAREAYRELGYAAAVRLGLPSPEGSTFLFVNVAGRLDGRGLQGFLEDAADRGLFMAPGTSFGPYPTHVRVCFTSAPPDVVRDGIEVLASLLDR